GCRGPSCGGPGPGPGPRTTGHDTLRARTLSQQLGGLPLALHLAGSYLGSDLAALDLAGYLREAQRSIHLLDLAAVGGHRADDPRSRVTTTWELSLNKLAEQGVPSARPLLRLLSYYAPTQPFPVHVLDPELLAAHGLLDGDDPMAAQFAGLSGLARFGLISSAPAQRPGEPSVLVHPLVAEASRVRRGEADRPEAVQAAAAELLSAATDRLDLHRTADWPRWRTLTPHAHALMDRLTTGDAGVVAHACHALNRAVEALIEARSDEENEVLIRHALAHADALSADHDEVVTARKNLAMVLWQRGKHAEAEKLTRAVLAVEERLRGPEHPDTLVTRANVSWSLYEQGSYEEAERTIRELLATETRVLGADHHETLVARHNLALVLWRRG
ncbi:tetratricopeptide repeat protein, partial [Streptomyces daliensis]|nr:tetratricopeptide repeat protein [Streptomyces daliensis]